MDAVWDDLTPLQFAQWEVFWDKYRPRQEDAKLWWVGSMAFMAMREGQPPDARLAFPSLFEQAPDEGQTPEEMYAALDGIVVAAGGTAVRR